MGRCGFRSGAACSQAADTARFTGRSADAMRDLGACAGNRRLGSSLKQSRGQENHGSQQPEHALDSDSDDAERNRQQPDDRPQHQRQQRNRPAQHEENQPEEKFEHPDTLTRSAERLQLPLDSPGWISVRDPVWTPPRFVPGLHPEVVDFALGEPRAAIAGGRRQRNG